MKKFLSLALALVMSLSLLTVGAGATEYKDLNDRDEIQYEEAVAVLNKLGIITGYEDGSFKPTGALTRGAAAKIIVSLMIGSEAASNLTVAAAPYKDVPVANTFASVISYCKTAGYISGYADGSFRPTAPLTGFAFTKMLLGALGYDGKVEGFTGSGWTMNVAKLGNKAGMFNDFNTAFSGNNGVTREAACLLALNTLKATEVEYDGDSVKVTGDNINVVVGNNKASNVPNNSNTDGNIYIEDGTDVKNGKDKFMQFAEEHFSDLKMAKSTSEDDFGRPANQWNYKSTEIGKYAKAADYTYTTTASGDTAADKVRDMGIKGYTLGGNEEKATGSVTVIKNGKEDVVIDNLEKIPGLLGKGTMVQLFTSDTVSNRITDIVVIETQLMQVKKVNSDNVTLKTVESDGTFANSVNKVEDDDNAYNTLKGLKADDYVIVTPVATSRKSNTYDVYSVFVPTTVTGNISKVKLDGKDVNGVTVAGTDYKLSKNWSAEDGRGNLASSSVSTTVQSTLLIDAYGFVIYAKDVTASSDYMIFDESYSTVVNGRIHYFAQGYDMSGNELSLDFGTDSSAFEGIKAGSVMKYTTEDAPDNADYTWDGAKNDAMQTIYEKSVVNAGSYKFNNIVFASDVKFIFLSTNVDKAGKITEVTGVTVKDGVQKVDDATDIAYTTNDKGTEIKVMVVMSDSTVEVSKDIMYVSEVTGLTKDSGGKNVSVFTAYIDGTETENLVANKTVSEGFYTYAEKDGIYTVNAYKPASSSANYVINNATLRVTDIESENFITTLGGTAALEDNQALDARNAVVIDLDTDDDVSYGSIKDLAQADTKKVKSFKIAIQYNASTTSSRGQVAYIYVLENIETEGTFLTVSSSDKVEFSTSADNFKALPEGVAQVDGTLYVRSKDPLQKVSNIAGIATTLVKAPETAKDMPIYKVTVDGDIKGSDAEVETNWYTVTVTAGKKVATGVTFNLTAGTAPAIVEKNGSVTVAVAAVATADTTADAAGVAAVKATSGAVGTPAISGADNMTNAITPAANGSFDLTTVANGLTGKTNNYTVEITGVVANTTISIA